VLLDDLPQRARRDVLHDDPRLVLAGDHVEDLHDVGVAQPGGGTRFAQGAQPQFLPLVVGQAGGQGDLLDRHLPP
jgi:hypothetical protein